MLTSQYNNTSYLEEVEVLIDKDWGSIYHQNTLRESTLLLALLAAARVLIECGRVVSLNLQDK